MEGGHQPFCDDYLVPLTIKHIALEYPNYDVERITCINNVNLNMKYMFLDSDTCFNGKICVSLRTLNILGKL